MLPLKLPLRANFINRINQQKVPGDLRIARPEDFQIWKRWEYSRDDEDKSWNWHEIYAEAKEAPERFECFSAVARGDLQGLARFDLLLKETPFGPAVTLDYIASNPLNRQPTSGLKSIGLAFIAAAIQRSGETVANVAIWLESLPRALTEMAQTFLQIARENGAEDGPFVLGDISLDLQKNSSEEILSIRIPTAA